MFTALNCLKIIRAGENIYNLKKRKTNDSYSKPLHSNNSKNKYLQLFYNIVNMGLLIFSSNFHVLLPLTSILSITREAGKQMYRSGLSILL